MTVKAKVAFSCTVTLASVAPAGGTQVKVMSSSVTVPLNTPPSVTVRPTKTTANVPIVAGPAKGVATVNVTAGEGTATQRADITIN
jgi:hypothetical protein